MLSASQSRMSYTYHHDQSRNPELFGHWIYSLRVQSLNDHRHWKTKGYENARRTDRHCIMLTSRAWHQDRIPGVFLRCLGEELGVPIFQRRSDNITACWGHRKPVHVHNSNGYLYCTCEIDDRYGEFKVDPVARKWQIIDIYFQGKSWLDLSASDPNIKMRIPHKFVLLTPRKVGRR